MSSYHKSAGPRLLGDDAAEDKTPVLEQPLVRAGLTGAGIYHGYKRTGSIVWALIYGLAARTVPVVTGAIVVAQGFGDKKGGSTP